MRKSTVLLGIIGLAGALSAFWSWQQLRFEREHVAKLERQLAEMRLVLNAAQEAAANRPALASTPVAAHQATAVASVAVATADTSKEVVDHVRAWQQREREMLRDPDYRKMQVEQGRRQFAQTRADAIRVAGMTPDQADRVIGLWVERNLRFTEMGAVTGQPPTEAQQAELKRAAEAEQAELRTLLGEEKFERWNRYLESGQERAEVNMFRSQLADSDPLRAEQADALVESIYSERQRRTQEYEEYAKSVGIVDRNNVSPQDRQRWLDLEKEANRRVHDAMAGNLSRAQLSSLDEMLAARLAPVEAALRMQLEGKLAKSD